MLSPAMKSNLDLLNECDVFPYAQTNPEAHAAILDTLYTLIWGDASLGYMLPSVVERLQQVPISIRGPIAVDHDGRTVAAFHHQPDEPSRSRVVAATMAYWREHKAFDVLAGWRDELYPVYGPGNELLFSIERAASALFGVVTYGVHMTAFVRDDSVEHGLKMWVPRRARSKQTYPGMLDNTVAGGIATGEDPFESLVREADEEASLPEALVRERARHHGMVTYMYIRERRAGGESGMVQPECQHAYDLELPADVVPKPNDTEVEAFYLWTVEQVEEHMAAGEFKPNCALMVLDFFTRHGILTKDNEEHYEDIRRRLHRELEFPGPHTG